LDSDLSSSTSSGWRRRAAVIAATALVLTTVMHMARAESSSAAAGPTGNKVVVAGVVPDEATRQALLAKVREVYGERVVDQLGVGNTAAPPNWRELVQRLISDDLKRVSKGQLNISGNEVELSGDVPTEAQGQQVIASMVVKLNPTYTVRNSLRVPAPGQEVLDASLANRTVEFQPGNATLTAGGARTLEELLPVLARFKNRSFEVIGHTDGLGAVAQNKLLSAERANAVKTFLVSRGIPAELISTAGAGAERPLAGNDTAEGRARNRRIEFRVMP
jgi:OOP family OmpA-OmpF porin